ncbi:MAG: flagellar basal body-associated FliL family protein [Oligoflexia bacterium]|nr:flagellar basal body-associated FliL family protein [Oligoflexia bacterium]
MTGNKILDGILMGFNLLSIFLVLAFFVYTGMFYVKPLPDNNVEFTKFKERSKYQIIEAKIYKLDRMVLNLQSRKARMRNIDLQVQFLLFKEEFIAFLETNKHVVYDKIIEIVAGMEADEINSVTGKILLEERIKKAVEEIAHAPVVKTVYFTVFVVQ